MHSSSKRPGWTSALSSYMKLSSYNPWQYLWVRELNNEVHLTVCGHRQACFIHNSLLKEPVTSLICNLSCLKESPYNVRTFKTKGRFGHVFRQLCIIHVVFKTWAFGAVAFILCKNIFFKKPLCRCITLKCMLIKLRRISDQLSVTMLWLRREIFVA